MNPKPQPKNVRLGFRYLTVSLGFISGVFPLLLFGASGGSRGVLWLIPAMVIALLAVCFMGRKVVPRLAAWFQAGITFLLSAVAGSLLLAGTIAAIIFANFDTEYAPGFSEKAFKSVQLGATEREVLARLGNPISSRDSEPFTEWIYTAGEQPHFAQEGGASGTYTMVTFGEGGRVKNISGQRAAPGGGFRIGQGQNYLNLTDEDIGKLKGRSRDEIRQQFGTPAATYEYKAARELSYSRSPSSGNYYLRAFGLDQEGKVVHIWNSIYWD